jgi:hypothetical protein
MKLPLQKWEYFKEKYRNFEIKLPFNCSGSIINAGNESFVSLLIHIEQKEEK